MSRSHPPRGTGSPSPSRPGPDTASARSIGSHAPGMLRAMFRFWCSLRGLRVQSRARRVRRLVGAVGSPRHPSCWGRPRWNDGGKDIGDRQFRQRRSFGQRRHRTVAGCARVGRSPLHWRGAHATTCMDFGAGWACSAVCLTICFTGLRLAWAASCAFCAMLFAPSSNVARPFPAQVHFLGGHWICLALGRRVPGSYQLSQ